MVARVRRQLDGLEAGASDRGRQIYRLLTLMLQRLQRMDAAPAEDTAMIKRVRQSHKHTVWRVSHPYQDGIALRLICWFPPGEDRVVVALFSGDKASMGDVFYDSVGTRADQMVDRWLQDTEEES